MPSNSLRSLSFSSRGSLPYNVAKSILEFSNYHFFNEFKELFKGYKINE